MLGDGTVTRGFTFKGKTISIRVTSNAVQHHNLQAILKMSLTEVTHQNITHCVTVWPIGYIFLSKAHVIFNAIFNFVGLIGNAVLLIGLVKSKLIRQNTMKVIFSLGISDFGICAIVSPMVLVILTHENIDCKLQCGLMVINFLFGINTGNMLVLLSIDRVLLIAWPSFYRKYITVKCATGILVGSWIVSSIFAISALYINPLTIIKAVLATSMTYFTLSVLSYARISYTVHKHKRQIRVSIESRHSTRKTEAENTTTMPRRKIAVAPTNRTRRISFKLKVEVFDDNGRQMETEIKHCVCEEIEEECTPADIAEITSLNDDAQGSKPDLLQIPQEGEVGENPWSNSTSENNSVCERDCKIVDIEKKAERQSQHCISEVKHDMAREAQANSGDKEIKSNSLPQRESTNSLKRRLDTRSKLQLRKQQQRRTNAQSFKKELKVTWTVAMVISTLFLCYIPFAWSAILWAYEEYEKDSHASYRRRSVYAWTMALAYLHSSLNPVIMISRNSVLRKTIKQLVVSFVQCRD